jgi:hypothetical protein
LLSLPLSAEPDDSLCPGEFVWKQIQWYLILAQSLADNVSGACIGLIGAIDAF